MDDAVRHIAAAVEAAPRQPTFRLNLGAALNLAGRSYEALATFTHAVALHPDLPEAHNGIGSAMYGSDAVKAALASYARRSCCCWTTTRPITTAASHCRPAL